jgi:hypothetical protein
MTREEAAAEARQRNAAETDAGKLQWVAIESDAGEWTLARVPTSPRTPHTATSEAQAKPPQGDDPRSPLGRTLPYHGI